MSEEQCVPGCKAYTGGERRHHEDCPHYEDSFTQLYDRAIARAEAAEAERDALREYISTGDAEASAALQARLDAAFNEGIEAAAGIAEAMSRVTPAPMNDGCGTVLLQPVDGYQVGKRISDLRRGAERGK